MTRRTAITFAALAALAVSALAPVHAAAHPTVDEGRELLMEAEFEQALEAFARAEEQDDLTREDLIELIAARCLAYLAMDDADALRQELRALASLDPDHEWGREAPPELGEAFAQTREVVSGVIEVSGSAEPVAGGITVSAEVANDHAGIVRQRRVFTRLGSGTWRRQTAATQAVPSGERLAYYAEAIGPGGAVVATDGTREDPKTSEPALSGGSLIRNNDDDDEGGVSPWVWIGIGAGVLAVAAVILTIVLVGSPAPDGTQPEMPIVIGF